MDIQIETLDSGVKQIRLNGRLDLAGTHTIDDKFAFNTTTAKAHIVVDMTAVDFIASIGMRMLLSGAKGVSNRGGKMVLYNPQPLVKEALLTSGIDKLIPIHDDFEAACTSALAI